MQVDITLFLVLLFFAVVLISQALLMPAVGSRTKIKQLNRRLKQTEAVLDEKSRSLLQEQYQKTLTPLDRSLIKIPILASMQRKIDISGLNWVLSTMVGILITLSVIAVAVLYWLEQDWYLMAAALVVIWVAPKMYVEKCTAKRLSLFEEMLPEALDIMRRMLQAGMPISQAIGEVGEEMPEPIGSEFKNTFNLLNFGYDMRLAIMQMAERTPTISILAFSSAVLLQKDTGGNLSENLDKVSKVLRSRFKLARKIKTISAESRMSAWILVLAPFILFIFMSLFQPAYMAPLYEDPRGIKMVTFGLISLVFGAFWIRKIVNFEV